MIIRKHALIALLELCRKIIYEEATSYHYFTEKEIEFTIVKIDKYIDAIKKQNTQQDQP